jgi:hypothetical protein
MSTTNPNEEGAPDDVRARFQLIVARTERGKLNKHITLSADGTSLEKRTFGTLSCGTFTRVLMPNNGPEGAPEALKGIIEGVGLPHAIITGALVGTAEDETRVLSKKKIEPDQHRFLARTVENIAYRPGVPSWFLLD